MEKSFSLGFALWTYGKLTGRAPGTAEWPLLGGAGPLGERSQRQTERGGCLPAPALCSFNVCYIPWMFILILPCTRARKKKKKKKEFFFFQFFGFFLKVLVY